MRVGWDEGYLLESGIVCVLWVYYGYEGVYVVM
jgi:hypothetical protein